MTVTDVTVDTAPLASVVVNNVVRELKDDAFVLDFDFEED